MANKILGLHHITALADHAQRNFDFYTKTLGLRFVKKTVNFDDPGTYHFYYGNENGTPGTILTFFPWEGIGPGRNGTGMASEITFSVPQGSLDFWKDRLSHFNIKTGELTERFGMIYLPFYDPDGLHLSFVVTDFTDNRPPWSEGGIAEHAAIKGFDGVTLCLSRLEPTAKVLTDILGYAHVKQDGSHYRFQTDAISTAHVVDILVDENGRHGRQAGGTIHHVAFRVKDEDAQQDFREKIIQMGLNATEKIDRNYFYSIYFREPGGILFEIATDNPGFTNDEPLSKLGSDLKLPRQYEPIRDKIEKALPVLNID